jgi:hypothetical protein
MLQGNVNAHHQQCRPIAPVDDFASRWMLTICVLVYLYKFRPTLPTCRVEMLHAYVLCPELNIQIMSQKHSLVMLFADGALRKVLQRSKKAHGDGY